MEDELSSSSQTGYVLPPLSQGQYPSQGYRSAEPFLPSSSPSNPHKDHDHLKSPVTPPSSPPLRTHTRYRTTSANDPFSAAAKAGLNQHPSFGKEYPHVKHPGRGKRSLPPSPSVLEGSAIVTGSVAGSLDPSSSQSTSASSWRSSQAVHRRTIAGSRVRRGKDDLSSDSGTDVARDRALARAFEFSDDAPTSDDHLEAVPWEQPSSDTDGGMVGLGLGPSFQEEGSPSAGRRRPESYAPVRSSAKRSAFSRSSSVNDPFGAFGSTLFPTHDHRPISSTNSPGSGQPLTQRRRLVGTSPKKLTVTGQSGWAGAMSESDEEVDTRQSARDRRLSAKPMTTAQTWHKLVEQVWDSGDTRIDISDRQLDAIHPIVADLAKYVAIEPPRSFEPTTSTSSLPSRMHPAQGQISSRTPFARTSTSVTGGSACTSPAGPSTQGKLQLYLANNHLTKIPSALFEVGNLRVLSLRKNSLSELPCAVGQLRNLRELNVANNQLRYLPAEIQKLSLDVFSYFPNPFMMPPKDVKLEVRSVHCITGSLMASISAASEDAKDRDEDQVDEPAQDDGDNMEAEFLAAHQSDLNTPGNMLSSQSSMGPPPLPVRFTRGPAGVLPQPLTGSVALPRRIFDRTRSDAQVDELLARGGGRMLARPAGPQAPSNLGTMMEVSAPNGDDSLMEETSAPSPKATGMQILRYLGPLKASEPAVPSLQELCIRSILSPCEASRPPSPEPLKTSQPAIADAAPSLGGSRPVVWTRVPSTSLAFQHQTQRPMTLLESYENGVLRELDTDCRLNAATISLLEAARRSIEGKWGSGSGAATSSRGTRAGEQDSWCKGVAGKTSDDEEAGATMRSKEEDDADASSPGSDDGFDQTIVSLSPSLHRRATSTAAMGTLPPPQDISTKLDSEGDDATCNPHFNRCPNPLHPQSRALAEQAGIHADVLAGTAMNMDYPLAPLLAPFAPLFAKPCEERVEWVSHIGGFRVLGGKADVEKLKGVSAQDHNLLPLLWRGCSRGCLAFLEE
ncbi:hypothetical protein BCV69DRAFT_273577 [Microstroma glucosiphilum]|uniref:L domain-like protein n=1 Tax=Pseudomicrostroma glucosiphilum TaxID=1684307 RepID=A0A316U071_9BASI|nr:hypothetical protein BCV69DRAFT_273577 [Pseudomicrostroma glucosiphilum]PWN18620.1 hypothetical protein BCV69DRAFT_273577 [Pseudomicrostroma glucosiphilum]